VTMVEKGVSRLVSVDLEAAEALLAEAVKKEERCEGYPSRSH
jgi:hypothetical protein